MPKRPRKVKVPDLRSPDGKCFVQDTCPYSPTAMARCGFRRRHTGRHSWEAPKRIQRRRTKGWRMPEGAVYVGRPTKWGNPFAAVDVLEAYGGDEARARADCVRSYREAIRRWCGVQEFDVIAFRPSEIATLRGKDLACFCPLDQPCHADVLLELANAPDEGSR